MISSWRLLLPACNNSMSRRAPASLPMPCNEVHVYGCYSRVREGAYLIIAKPGDRDLLRHMNVPPLALHTEAPNAGKSDTKAT